MPDLLAVVESELYDALTQIEVELPYTEGRLISLFYEHAIIEHAHHGEDSVVLQGKMQAQYTPYFREFNLDYQNIVDVEALEEEND
jgi:50S ribosomal subunit-associated GTPase HflX